MALFSGFFEKPSRLGAKPVSSAGSEPVEDLESVIARLEPVTTGKRFVDADPQYSEVIRNLPSGKATSMRLSESEGTLSITGEEQRVFGYPGTLDYNMPALTELAGMSRILIDLGYSGVEEEAEGIACDVSNSSYRLRFSCPAMKSYPLIRLQISFYSYLQEPLHLEVLSDILDCNVQDFYRALVSTGRYELSVHVTRNHIGSIFSSISPKQQAALSGGISRVASHLESIEPARRDMSKAVQECERIHPLGEKM